MAGANFGSRDCVTLLREVLADIGSVPRIFTSSSADGSRMGKAEALAVGRAAQSTFAVGEVGPPRNTPDYYAVRVMNALLGELFQSRLNHNIREEKGYSYGVSSRFSFGRGPGPLQKWREPDAADLDGAVLRIDVA